MGQNFITVEMVRRAGKRLEFNRKHKISSSIPRNDFWGNMLPILPSATAKVKVCTAEKDNG